jgi:hypothetical protein
VELLRDGKGIYGIGIAKESEIDHPPNDLILRHDRLEESKTERAALQMITGGFRHGMFIHMSEERLRQVIHHGLLRRRGLAWPPPQASGSNYERYWSPDPQQQIINRRIYHGLRLGSLSIVNRLIGRALEDAADQEAVKVARRFRFYSRYAIYRAAAVSPRAVQIATVFPVLALAIFRGCDCDSSINLDLIDYSIDYPCSENLRLDATRLVDVGAPLKTIADLMHVPMAFRKIKPAAAELGLSVIGALDDQRLIHAYLPDSLPRMKLWLRCIQIAKYAGPEFVEWVAKHSLEVGGTPDEVLFFLSDLKDWVRACHPRHILGGDRLFHQPHGEQFVVRRFSPDMSLATVMKLSGDWHEAVANNMSGPFYEFPEPWCCAGLSCGYEIVPIANAADLYREGHSMHHCVGSYADRVAVGEVYLYSIRKDKERIATLELVRRGETVALGQVRGSCNTQTSKQIMGAARSWLRSQSEVRFPKQPDIADSEVPF